MHGLAMLTDGMDGYKSGEVVSEMAMLVTIAAFTELLHLQGDVSALSIPEILQKAVQRTNEAIINTSQEYAACEGMDTTFVGGVFIDNTIVVGHVGDSRMYRLMGNELLQLTEDHSLLQEKSMQEKSLKKMQNTHLMHI
jgi:serine/threonine protein phosphatase PrpC